MENNNYKGFSLFNDIEDETLRDRNRGVTMANIVEMNYDNKAKKITPKGASLVIGYFNQIALEQRKKVSLVFERFLKERGFAVRTHS